MSTLVEFPGLGLEMTISRVAFSVFGVEVYWYGLIIALGLMVGIGIGFANAKRFGVDADRMTDVILVTVVLAVLCARLYYVIFYPGDYDSLGKILNLRDGGLAIYGGVIGAVVFGWLMCRIRRVPVWAMFDMTAMGFLAGQGIGRWGNFFNQEAFGSNTTLPWGMYSERTHNYLRSAAEELAAQGVVVDPTAPVHPTFLYESLWCLLGLVLLLCYKKTPQVRRRDGAAVCGVVRCRALRCGGYAYRQPDVGFPARQSGAGRRQLSAGPCRVVSAASPCSAPACRRPVHAGGGEH